MTGTYQYFAYGSNMLSTRLLARCDSARFRTVACVFGYRVGFNKWSIDESGKATLVRTGVDSDRVTGVVFDIDVGQSAALDVAEGDGYLARDPFDVTCMGTGRVIPTRTYIARELRDDLAPYDWYLALILAGISEHQLGEPYAASFRALAYVEDLDVDRHFRREALLALDKAGIADYSSLLR